MHPPPPKGLILRPSRAKNFPPSPAGAVKRPVLLHCHQSPGDSCIASIVVESLARQYPGRFAIDVMGIYTDAIFAGCPHITRVDRGQVQPIKCEQPLIDRSHVGHSFAYAMCRHVGERLGVDLIPQVNRPHFYFSARERSVRPLAEPYIMVNAGWKDDGETKWYSRWQAVADLFQEQYPEVKVVQVGESFHHHPPLQGKNVLNMIGRWDGQGRVPLVWAYHSLLGLGGITFLMHVFGGCNRPYVCVATGYEPPTWACNYLGQKYISRFGTLPCCRNNGCWLRSWSECKHMKGEKLPACLDIPAEEVMAAIKDYFHGLTLH